MSSEWEGNSAVATPASPPVLDSFALRASWNLASSNSSDETPFYYTSTTSTLHASYFEHTRYTYSTHYTHTSTIDTIGS